MEDQKLSPETQELIDAVDGFAAEMKQRLIQKSKEGYKGWKDQYTITEVQNAILSRIHRVLDPNDPVEIGIANWALIAHLLKTKQNDNS